MSFGKVCYLFGSLSTYGIMAQNFALHAESCGSPLPICICIIVTPVSRF